MSWTTLVMLAVAAACGCAAIVPLVRRLAFRVGAVDVPDERRVHRDPTPRLGGLAVIFGFGAAVTIAVATGVLVSGGTGQPDLLALLAGGLIVLAVGVLDDVRSLRPGIKLAAEIAAASIVVYVGGCRIGGLSGPGEIVVGLGSLAAPFTVVWIVLVTNALNLVDGIDGLASGTGVIILGAIAVIALGFEMPLVATLAALGAGACAGFLVHNFHPATIFLGDSGSLSIGFGIGVLSTYARAKGTTGAITLATLLIVALPLGDAFWAMNRRYFRGLSPQSLRSHLAGFSRMFEPDRNHLHHRLLRAGLGQRAATYALYAIQVIACACAIYLLVRS